MWGEGEGGLLRRLVLRVETITRCHLGVLNGVTLMGFQI